MLSHKNINYLGRGPEMTLCICPSGSFLDYFKMVSLSIWPKKNQKKQAPLICTVLTFCYSIQCLGLAAQEKSVRSSEN